MIQTILGALGSLGKLFDFLKFWQTKKAGRVEAELGAAKRELARAKLRKKIDRDVRYMSPDELERLLADDD